MWKRLIFRVDDLGYTPAYDMGAYKAFEAGIGSSADVMLDSPDTVGALTWLKDKPWLSVGWHRHLWESPVLPPEEVPSMVDEEGRFKWRHRHQELMAEVPYEEAYKEFMAEAALCKSILGRYPDIATDRGDAIPLEKAFIDVLEKCGIVYGHFSSVPGHRMNKVCREKYKDLKIFSAGIQTGKGFDLQYFQEYDPLKTMMSLQWTEAEEVYFYGWHPGYCDDHIMAESTCNIHRCKELQAATSRELRNWIIENKIELVNQRDVLYGTSEFQDHLRDIGSPLWAGNF